MLNVVDNFKGWTKEQILKHAKQEHLQVFVCSDNHIVLNLGGYHCREIWFDNDIARF